MNFGTIYQLNTTIIKHFTLKRYFKNIILMKVNA